MDGVGKSEARRVGDDDIEGIIGVSTVSNGVDQEVDEVEVIGGRTGIGVREQRCRIRVRRSDVDEVDRLSVYFRAVVGNPVQALFVGAPVEAPPLLDRIAQVVVRGAGGPVVGGSGSGKPGAGEPPAEIIECVLRDLDPEGADAVIGSRAHAGDRNLRIGSIGS